MTNKYYITTPIYYANGSPHVGHLLTTTVADCLARYYRKKIGQENVFFTTGLDEHGTTVEQSALKEGYKPEEFQNYVDKRSEEWKKAFDETNISYDFFVRTTSPTHKQFAQNFIQKMIDNDDIYKAAYKGKYCYGCEKFLTLSDQNEEGLCPLHRPDQVIETEEENYFFKLSKYAPKVKGLISNNTIKIHPEGKKQEMLSRIDLGVDDLSISRPKEKVGWAVEFPNDSNQTVYVWVEALINYLSSLEITNRQDLWKSVVHALGKDINWFHNVIWPAFLLSANYPLPKNTFVHSYLSIGGKKISKSLGNTLTPQDLISKYGIDGARYLVLKNIPYKNDVDLTLEMLDERYNADLANGLGNTAARITKLAQNSGLEFEFAPIDENIWHQEWANPLTEFKVDETLQNIWRKISGLDKHVNENEPWKIEDLAKLKAILEFELNELKLIATIIEPFLPETSAKLQNHLKNGQVAAIGGLFPRI
jgi:methionyl-tRNA synthetase